MTENVSDTSAGGDKDRRGDDRREEQVPIDGDDRRKEERRSGVDRRENPRT